MKNKNVLIVTDLSFPEGSAMASRLLAFCKLFYELGYKIHVITGKYEGNTYLKNKVYQNELFSFEIIDSRRNYQKQSFLGNENLPSAVDNYLNNNDVEFVFSTSLNVSFSKIHKICEKNKVKHYIEQCEWYDYSSFRFGKVDPRYIVFNLNIRRNFFKIDGVISISRYLNDYYNSNNVKSIRIPAIYDVENSEYSSTTNNRKINLIYTGNPSKSKELILPIIEAIDSKEKYRNKIRFDIYGCNEKQLQKNINNLEIIERNKDSIKIHGFVDKNTIEKSIIEADYQIFIKPDRRSSKACFPTKLCESMSAGTPIITNDTGDICLYLKDGKNGFVVDGTSFKDVCKVFDKIIELSNDKYISLRKNSRMAALNNFDYRIYIDYIKDFINAS